MANFVRDASIWKNGKLWVRDKGIWKEVKTGWIKEWEIWTPFYESKYKTSGSFETGLEGWFVTNRDTINPSSSYTIMTTGSRTGIQSVRLGGTGIYWTGFNYTLPQEVSSGKVIRVGLWAKRSHSNISNVYLDYGSGSVKVAEMTGPEFPAGEWRHFQIDIPNNTTSPVRLCIMNLSGNNDVYDDWSIEEIGAVPILGQPYGGGFYIGDFTDAGQKYALVVAPKAQGQINSIQWKTTSDGPWVGTNMTNGMANIQAMMADGISKYPLAQHCKDLTMGGFSDWYIPSIEESKTIQSNLSNLVGVEAYDVGFGVYYWLSSEPGGSYISRGHAHLYSTAPQSVGVAKTTLSRARAIRRVLL